MLIHKAMKDFEFRLFPDWRGERASSYLVSVKLGLPFSVGNSRGNVVW